MTPLAPMAPDSNISNITGCLTVSAVFCSRMTNQHIHRWTDLTLNGPIMTSAPRLIKKALTWDSQEEMSCVALWPHICVYNWLEADLQPQLKYIQYIGVNPTCWLLGAIQYTVSLSKLSVCLFKNIFNNFNSKPIGNQWKWDEKWYHIYRCIS